VHIFYNVTLVQSYRRNDLAQAYPIARGSSPLLVTLGAALFAHEAIGPLHIFGILMISGGIIAIALEGSRVSRAGALAALTTGATIAVYTVIDGIGVRLSDGQALAYTAWMFLFYWLMPVLFVAMRGRAALWTPVRAAPMALGSSLVGGLVSIAAYGIVIWALQSGAMGAVSALRETSVVFAVLIGRMFLRETVSGKRWLACVVVAAGAVCLGL
jgi:drug/metabolite transporter (DMT)-like permease